MAKAFGIVTSTPRRIHVAGLQDYRSAAAFSFLGRYRVIDFPISNLSNSGIDNIQVYLNKQPRSLTEHLGTGAITTSTPSAGACSSYTTARPARTNCTIPMSRVFWTTWTISSA
jgi:ADP-glucose pyrophosphorylase